MKYLTIETGMSNVPFLYTYVKVSRVHARVYYRAKFNRCVDQYKRIPSILLNYISSVIPNDNLSIVCIGFFIQLCARVFAIRLISLFVKISLCVSFILVRFYFYLCLRFFYNQLEKNGTL